MSAENGTPVPAVREEELLGQRLETLTQELRDRSIRRDLWASIREEADRIKTVKELDDYLDRMEANHSRFL